MLLSKKFTFFSINRLGFKFLFFLVMPLIILGTPFAPIEAGYFQITASDLKGLNKITTKEIKLSTDWQIFEQNLNINIACVIVSINVDERVSLQWTYKLVDGSSEENTRKYKIILVKIVDKNGYSYPELHIGINFLIAQNLRSDYYNMTDFQQHLMHQSLTPQEGDPANKQVHNQLFLFPNGFSSFNLTHNIMYSYISDPYDMYAIHYMTGMKDEKTRQGWNPGQDFILFRYILFPKFGLGSTGCPIVFQHRLMQDFTYNCDQGSFDGYFFGIMGSSGAKFAGQFLKTRKGFIFKVKQLKEQAMYNILAIPLKITEKFNFIDNRLSKYNDIQEKKFFLYLTVAIILLIGIIILIVLIKKKKKKSLYFGLQTQKTSQIEKEKPVEGSQKAIDEEMKNRQND